MKISQVPSISSPKLVPPNFTQSRKLNLWPHDLIQYSSDHLKSSRFKGPEVLRCLLPFFNSMGLFCGTDEAFVVSTVPFCGDVFVSAAPFFGDARGPGGGVETSIPLSSLTRRGGASGSLIVLSEVILSAAEGEPGREGGGAGASVVCCSETQSGAEAVGALSIVSELVDDSGPG